MLFFQILARILHWIFDGKWKKPRTPNPEAERGQPEPPG